MAGSKPTAATVSSTPGTVVPVQRSVLSTASRPKEKRKKHAPASVYGGFDEVHTYSTCRWTLDPCSVPGLPKEYKKM